MLTPRYDPELDDIRLADTEDSGMIYDPYLEKFRMRDSVNGISYDPELDEVLVRVDPTVAAVIFAFALSNITEETIDYTADVACDIETQVSIEYSLNEDMSDATSVVIGPINGDTTVNGQLTGLTPGSTVYVRMKAVNAGGESLSEVLVGGLLNGFLLTTDSEDGAIQYITTDSEDGQVQYISIDTEDQ